MELFLKFRRDKKKPEFFEVSNIFRELDFKQSRKIIFIEYLGLERLDL